MVNSADVGVVVDRAWNLANKISLSYRNTRIWQRNILFHPRSAQRVNAAGRNPVAWKRHAAQRVDHLCGQSRQIAGPLGSGRIVTHGGRGLALAESLVAP